MKSNADLGILLRITSPERKETDRTISFSQYSIYQQCPFRWKLNYIDRQRISSPNMIMTFGSAVHETLQIFLHNLYKKSVKDADAIDLNILLQERMVELYAMEVAQNNDIHFSTPEEMQDYYNDGVEILNWIRKHRSEYFNKRNWELLGVEMPIYIQASKHNEHVKMNGFLDLVFRDTDTDEIHIYDIKTSYRGWGDNDKKNVTKTSQLVLYKHYFAKQYGYDVEKIHIKYFIVKRKILQESLFPQKRVQEFVPSSGTITRKKLLQSIDNFVLKCFNNDGTYNTSIEYPATTNGGKSCKYCEFKTKYDICSKEKRIKN